MFCKYCGNRLPDGANFCPECGKVNEESTEKNGTSGQTSYETVDPFENTQSAYDPYKLEKERLSGSILKFAIMSLVFMSTGCLSLLGLIFACVAKSKVKTYVQRFGATEGRANVGRHLSTAGLISSIVVTAIFVLYLFIVVVALGMSELMAF